MRKRILERIVGQHQMTGDFNVKCSRSTMNTEISSSPVKCLARCHGWRAMGQANIDTFLSRREGLESTQAKPAVNQLCCWQLLHPSQANNCWRRLAAWSLVLPTSPNCRRGLSLRCPSDFLGNFWVPPGGGPMPWRTVVCQSLGSGVSSSLLQTEGFLAEAC